MSGFYEQIKASELLLRNLYHRDNNKGTKRQSGSTVCLSHVPSVPSPKGNKTISSGKKKSPRRKYTCQQKSHFTVPSRPATARRSRQRVRARNAPARRFP